MRNNNAMDYLFVESEEPEIPKAALVQKMSRRYRKNRRQMARLLAHLWPPPNLDGHELLGAKSA